MKKYWVCIMGPVEDEKLPSDADFYPSIAAQRAVIDMTGEQLSCYSGWDCGEEKFKELLATWKGGIFKCHYLY